MRIRLNNFKALSSVRPGGACLWAFFVTALIVPSLAMVFFIGGCAGLTAGTPKEIMKKAIAAQAELKSVQLRMDSEMELKSPAETRTASISYKGVYEKPDKWSLQIQSNGMKSEAIIIGSAAYLKTPGTDVWERRTTDLMGGDSSTKNIVDLDYMKAASDVRMVDQKGGNYHMEFNLDVAANASLFNVTGVTEIDRSLVKGKKAQMEVWIQKETYYVEEARLSFSRNPSGEEAGGVKVSIETRFSDFNEPVSIEPPI